MKRALVFLILISLIGFLFLGVYLPKNQLSEKKVIFNIEKGQGSKEIALNLEKQGFINWAPLFRLYVLSTGKSAKLQAGTYLVSASMSISQIAQKFASGKIAKIEITFPEGFTAKQIQEKLKDVAELELAKLENFEGYLFPDTYEVPYGITEKELIEMMTTNFNKKTAKLKITPEIVVMASLLEKEVKNKEEKELVSGILWKRLKIGMPLQVDAKMWTYKNRGLPLSPIANPGLESIEAAVFPKDSQYWYYLSTSEGQTMFSQTLEEHNIAKAKYLK